MVAGAGRRPGRARAWRWGRTGCGSPSTRRPDDGLPAHLHRQGGGAATLRVIDGSDGLDGLPGFEPRPDGVDAAGSHSSDLVLVAATIDLG